MKRYFIFLLPAVFLVFFQQNSSAQTRTVSGNQITISVSGIEYDDPGFGLLKESLQKTKNTGSIKPGYAGGAATISLTYTGTATALWDDLPKTTKDFFKLTGIDDDHIALTGKNTAVQNNSASNTNSNQSTGNRTSDDCKNCYWSICNYDVVKSIGGKSYKGIITPTGTFYYNCDNGVLIQKTLTVNAYGSLVDAGSDTILVSSGPVGTRWGFADPDNAADGGILSAVAGTAMSFQKSGGYTLIAKNVTGEINGKSYRDLIVVNYRGFSKDPFTGSNSYNYNYYYAKGVGLVKTDELNINSDPVSAINKQGDKHSVYSGGGTITNGIDQTITGTWVYHDKQKNSDGFYKFNADGTFDYYYNAVTEANKIPGTNHWKMEQTPDGSMIIDLAWAGGGTFIKRTELEKKNDAATGKPALVLDGAVFISADNKRPWSNN